nr:m-phase inducer phosphatase [Quercus suber]
MFKRPHPLVLTAPKSRRKRPVTRPSLSRHKGFSTSSVPQPQRSTSPETQLPPFRFGNVAPSNLSCSSTPSLLESFAESPVDDRSTVHAGGMLPSLRRTSVSNGARATGSPSNGHVRKPSAGRPAFVRPQKRVMRRSLSMFQHPDEFMREEQDAFEPQRIVPTAMDIDQEHSPKLPHFIPSEEPDSLPRITRQTMVDILESRYSTQYDQVMVIDCRFEYEYEGGHIQDAVNFNDKQQLAQKLFDGRPPSPSTLLILHCEYSVHRAPLTAKFIRSHDRNVNAHCYPQLTFPEMYILDGGYSKFFEEHRSKCYPQNYVEMNDQRHEQACERGMAKVKGRQKLFRHQTFAFGQNGPDDMDDSPTGHGRGGMGVRTRSAFDVGPDLAHGIGQSFQRRMASY